MSSAIVYVALRPESSGLMGPSRAYRVAYFATKEEVMLPWKLSDTPEKDISELMKHYGWKSVAEALKVMNR